MLFRSDIDKLADKIVNGGSGVWGDVMMSPHPGMDKENAKKMVKYILSGLPLTLLSVNQMILHTILVFLLILLNLKILKKKSIN